MFRSGNDFKYSSHSQNGNYKLKLSSFEVSVQEMSKEMNEHKTDLLNLKTKTDSLKRTLSQKYSEVRKDINEEISDFECKLKMEFNQQKIKNMDIRRDLNGLTNDLVQTRNLHLELKERLSALQLRIHGD